MMKMNAEKFLKTEFGAELENCIKCWDLYLTEKDYGSARLCQENIIIKNIKKWQNSMV